ncbi:MAG: hypothetical protein S4CHLAM2_14420 [Chlamydiales bacterium]|nr:hypothetical protein [Chlamydiales bacterium]
MKIETNVGIYPAHSQLAHAKRGGPTIPLATLTSSRTWSAKSTLAQSVTDGVGSFFHGDLTYVINSVKNAEY